MVAALLCNGPSRILYNSDNNYDYVIGCNIPWASVDATVIMDIEVVHKIVSDNLPTVNTFFGRDVWRELHHKTRSLYDDKFLGIVDTKESHDNSGHLACRKLIELGYKKIDVYGCDSFTNIDNATTDSYTHKYIDTRFASDEFLISNWNKIWLSIINNSDVEINFIKG